MSSSLRLLTRRPCRPFLPQPQHPLRPFSTAQRLRLKEDKERSAEEADSAVRQQQKKAEQGKGEWHEDVASQSESHIAAEKDSRGPEQLQRDTARETQENHPETKK